MSWYDWIPSPIFQAGNAASGGTPFGLNPSQIFGIGSGDPSNKYRDALNSNAQQASAFGRWGLNQYQANQAGINQSIQALRDQAAGKNSVSAEQLRQGMQQGLAAQQSMAAGANPANAAMAARNAQMNMSRLGYGLSGQQALAGLQERQQAQQQLSQLQLGQAGQNMQAGLGGYNSANQAYSTALGNPQNTWGPYLQKAAEGAASVFAMSDERAKTRVGDGTQAADRALKGLSAYTYDYKDPRNGTGQHLGVMAQDIEKIGGLSGAVVNTPSGKYVNGAKLAMGLAAMLPGIDERLSKLEEKKQPVGLNGRR